MKEGLQPPAWRVLAEAPACVCEIALTGVGEPVCKEIYKQQIAAARTCQVISSCPAAPQPIGPLQVPIFHCVSLFWFSVLVSCAEAHLCSAICCQVWQRSRPRPHTPAGTASQAQGTSAITSCCVHLCRGYVKLLKYVNLLLVVHAVEHSVLNGATAAPSCPHSKPRLCGHTNSPENVHCITNYSRLT